MCRLPEKGRKEIEEAMKCHKVMNRIPSPVGFNPTGDGILFMTLLNPTGDGILFMTLLNPTGDGILFMTLLNPTGDGILFMTLLIPLEMEFCS